LLPDAFGIFGRPERDVALMMIEERKAIQIPDRFIPESEQRDHKGRQIIMAIIIDPMKMVEFETRVKALKASVSLRVTR
jgi:hypothetical protein